MTEKDKKRWENLLKRQKMISTSKWRVEHLFAGQNAQQEYQQIDLWPSHSQLFDYEKVDCDTLLLRRALKQSDWRINGITKSMKCSLFSMQGNFSANRKDLWALTLVGLTSKNLVLDPLGVQHLDNRLCILISNWRLFFDVYLNKSVYYKMSN